MGFITTGAGYGLLLLAPFILFQQIALFTLFGLLGALITVLFLFPLLQPLVGGKPTAQQVPGVISCVNSLQHKLILRVKKAKWLFIALFTFSLMAFKSA